MPKIRVNTSRLSEYESDMQGILNRVNAIMEQFNNVSRSLDWDIKGETNINYRLSGISRELDNECRGIDGMKSYLGIAISRYDAVETANSGNDSKDEEAIRGYIEDVYIRIRNRVRSILNGRLGRYNGDSCYPRYIDPECLGKAPYHWIRGKNISKQDLPSIGIAETALIWFFRKAMSIGSTPGLSMEFTKGKWSVEDVFNDSLDKRLKDSGKKGIPKQEEKTIKEINSDEKFYDQKETIIDTKVERKIEGSILADNVSENLKYAQGSAEGKVFTGTAAISGTAGLYVYEKDKDGNVKKIFSPGVSAEVGAGVAVIQTSAEGRVGLGKDKNMLGLHGKVGAEVVSGKVNGKVAVNRKEVYAGAGAEANLCKVEGEAGVSLLGTDVGVTGALKVGLGAHAEIGYTDGKIKAEVGAAIGIGADVGFEIDVGGTVDAIQGCVKSGLDKICDIFE